jgi:hypothetical protein
MSQRSGCELGTVQRFELLERAAVLTAVESGDFGGLAERVRHRLFQPGS